ncbi:MULTISPECIES: hypothetical protein [unclassified Endozoicomonas]|uniref:hypothetical protein n=1 Tax=unclassified Endozoicomonas TaxID=2644528 RepID=UPI003BB6E12D
MTNTHPNALSLAVTFAICSSITGTQALADRKLQTKSADILGNGHVEFTQSVVRVQPTSGDDQQPIPKSITTTYPYEPAVNEDLLYPSISFSEIFYNTRCTVSSVDQFETDENNVARKYTKVLKAGNEGVFRITHNLEENELLIEVRGGMTDQDSIEVIRKGWQSHGIKSLEPSTKIATPIQLADVLDAANDRAGNLGSSDHYVALATIEVEKVEVNGRTFMRLVASGVQPPELDRLGQSLFVNDDALLAAAASAYIQVHVLEEDLQQQALNELLAHSKPVGYVVKAEDDTEVYPVPAGYPKLEVSEASEGVIVFHGQRLNPQDVAFVENLHKLWVETEANKPAPATVVNKHKVGSYQFAIRCRQMALLEELVATHSTGADKDQPVTYTEEDLQAFRALSHYEYLQQALASAAAAAPADEFEFSMEQVRVASSVITPTWMQIQLARHFSFKPALRHHLIIKSFAKGILSNLLTADSLMLDALAHNEEFASRVLSDIANQMVQMEMKLTKHMALEGKLAQITNELKLLSEKAAISEEEKLYAVQLKQKVESQLAENREVIEQLQEHSDQLKQEVKRIPELEQQVSHAREEAIKNYNTQLAAELGIDNWDNTQPSEEQIRLIIKKIHKMNLAVAATFAATGESYEEAPEAKLAAIESVLGITPDDESDLGSRFAFIQEYMEQRAELAEEEALAVIEDQLGLMPINKDDLKARHQAIQKHLEHQQGLEIQKKQLTDLRKEVDQTLNKRKDYHITLTAHIDKYNIQLAEELGIDSTPSEEQARLIREKINEIESSAAATEQQRAEALKVKMAEIEKGLKLTPDNENDLISRFDSIHKAAQYFKQLQIEVTDDVVKNRLTDIEIQLGLFPVDDKNLEARFQTVQLHLKQQAAQIDRERFLQQNIRKDSKVVAEIKPRYATIAAHLNIQNFDSDADIDEQQESLLKKIKMMENSKQYLIQRLSALEDHPERLHHKVEADRQDAENSYTEARKGALEAVLGIKLNEEDPVTLESTVHEKLSRLAELEQELEDVRTPGHPKAKPEVIEKLSAVENAMEMTLPGGEEDVYLRREAISDDIKTYIMEAEKRSEEEALNILEALEEIFHLEIDKYAGKEARLETVRSKFNGDDISEYQLDEMVKILTDDITLVDPEKGDIRLDRLREHLTSRVEESDLRAREHQLNYLTAIEKKLGINPQKNPAANKRHEAFTDKLASDMKLEFEKDLSLSDRMYALGAVLHKMMDELHKGYRDEAAKRTFNNRLARKLNVKEYKDDAAIHDQIELINGKLQQLTQQLDQESMNAGQPEVEERVAAIEDELDRQLGRLGPKPRFVLERDVATARQVIERANTELAGAHRKLNDLRRKQLVLVNRDGIEPISDEDNSALNQAMEKIQTELGLPAGDEQTTEERVDDINRFMQRDGAERRDEIIDKLEAATKNLNIQIKDHLRLPKQADYFAITAFAKIHGRDEINEVDETLGELPLTRKKYTQVTEFLSVHDRKGMDIESARHQKALAQENLDRKKEEINKAGGIEQKVKTEHENEFESQITDPEQTDLKQTPEQKSDAESEASKVQEAHKANIEATEKATGPEPDSTDIEKRDALRCLIANDASVVARRLAVQENLDRRKEAIAATEKATGPEPDSTDIEKRDALRCLIANDESEVVRRLAVQENLDRRKEAIENEIELLDLALKQKSDALSKAEIALMEHHKTALEATEEAVGLKPDASETNEQRIDALRKKQLQLGGEDGTGGRIERLIQEQGRLEGEIETRKADIERMKENLKTAEQTAENDGGPFQYTPRQVKVLADIYDFTQQHSLWKQALEAAIGLAASSEKSRKAIPCLATFDFDDEFAPIRLQAMAGQDLTFDQAGRMLEVFRSLKADFPSPPPPFEPERDQPQTLIEQVQILAHRARNEIGRGAKYYDEIINGMGETAIYFVEHESGHLKSFSEYFEIHSASGNKIITLLREGLISKVELENYIKAVRGVDGYQTVDEFEHFLGYNQGVKVPEFRKVVQMLSDKGAEELMRSAFTPVAVTGSGPAGMKESVAGMKDYAAAVIANYVLDDIAFENGRKTAAFLANVQDTLTPYAHIAGLPESDLIKIINSTLMQAHAAAVEQQLNEYWVRPSAFLVQAVTWYFSSYKPLLVAHTACQAARLSLSNMSFLYLLDLTNRGDYAHRMITPFEHWLERYGVDSQRAGQYAYHNQIEQVSEVGGLAMPLGKAASSVILLKTGSMLFARQHNANPHMYRSISRLVPEIVKSMGSAQGVQVPLLRRVTPQKVKSLASATAGLMLGPVATVGAYAHGLISGFTYAQTFGFALASSLTFDFFMNDNKILTQWLGGPLGRSLDKINRWRGVGESDHEYVRRTAIATPQRSGESDGEYANRVKAGNMMLGWTRHENYLQFRERRDRTIKLFEHGWEKYFKENVPKWSFSHSESVPYSYTLGTFFEGQKRDDKQLSAHDSPSSQSSFLPGAVGDQLDGNEEWYMTPDAELLSEPTETSSVKEPDQAAEMDDLEKDDTWKNTESALVTPAATTTTTTAEVPIMPTTTTSPTSATLVVTAGVTVASDTVEATPLPEPEATPAASSTPATTGTLAPDDTLAAKADPEDNLDIEAVIKDFELDEDWGDNKNPRDEL